MQDEINNQVIGLVYRGSKLTMNELTKLLVNNKIKIERACRSSTHSVNKTGKMSMQELKNKKQCLTSVEVTNNDIKDFEKIARKYNIDFALQKGKDERGPFNIVFFKISDNDSVNKVIDDLTKAREKRDHDKRVSLKEHLDKSNTKVKQADLIPKKKQRVKQRTKVL